MSEKKKPKLPISTAKAAEVLEKHNIWRRGGLGVPTDPFDLGLALEVAVRALRGEL